MRHPLTCATLLVWTLATAFLALAEGRAQAASPPSRIEVLLVWATNNQSTNKAVELDIRKKLTELPLKWANYFEMNRAVLVVPLNGSAKADLSEKCTVEVKNLGTSTMQIGLIGQGQPVVRRNQALPKGEIIAFGGNAPDETGWLVVIKRLD
jgi:hypothetical protein